MLKDSDKYPYQPVPTLVTVGFQGKAVLRVACGGVHNLSVAEPDQSLANSLMTLVDNTTLADVCFRSSEGNILHAHLCILKINAPRMYSFVQVQIEDKTAAMLSIDGHEVPVIDMSSVRTEVFLDFLHFVYTLDAEAAAMSLTSFAAVLELYHLGAKFQLSALLPRCRRIIRQQLRKQNIHQPWLSNFLTTPHASVGMSTTPLHSSSECAESVNTTDDTSAHLDYKDGLVNDCWGIFFLPGGQALVLDGTAYRDTLQRGTLLDLLDADTLITPEGTAALEEHMRSLLADERSADVRLVVRRDGASIFGLSAHKCILACRSAYFRALFSSEFVERSQSEVQLEDISPDQLSLLLNFIYTDEWAIEDQDFALDMIPIADRFSVLDLKRLCERTLICTMSIENVAQIFELADRYACSRLRNRAFLFMTHNWAQVKMTDGFEALDKQMIVEIIRNHETAPTSVPVPSEPLPGNSATAGKSGQSKSRDHRHGRGGGGAGGAGTARPVSVTAVAPAGGDHSRGGASSASPTTGPSAGVRAASSAPTDAAVPTAAQPSVADPPDVMTMSIGRSSMLDEVPPSEIALATTTEHHELSKT